MAKAKIYLRPLRCVKKKKIKCICITKENYPKILENYCNLILAVPADRVDRIQEMHIFVGHTLCEILEKELT